MICRFRLSGCLCLSPPSSSCDGILLVKDVIGDVIDGHGDHGDNLQRTAAEESVKHKVVLHLLIVSWYDITTAALN